MAAMSTYLNCDSFLQCGTCCQFACTTRAADLQLTQLLKRWKWISERKLAPAYYAHLPGSTHKELDMHGCVLSTVSTDALVLKHQATSIHNAD